MSDVIASSLVRSVSKAVSEVTMKQQFVVSLFALLFVAGCSSAGHGTVLPNQAMLRGAPATVPSGYRIDVLGSLGGTNSAANTLNDRGWAMGTSFLSGNQSMHAALWVGTHPKPIDLETLGGPNSAVEWPIENDQGYVAGISETSKQDPLGESKGWSCHAFLPDGGSSGDTCLGFVWYRNAMKPLPTLGGNNGYAAGMNQRDEIVGWAETSAHDTTCVLPQKLQFLPVVWNAHTLNVQKLPTVTADGKTDPDGAATAANANGEVVGISGICDQAVGRFTGLHAVLWRNGMPTALKTIGGISWNTPTAINDRGQIVGFLNKPGSADKKGDQNFISVLWNAPDEAPVVIGTLPNDALSEPTAINDRGDVLGVSFPSSHVYLWRKHHMTDLTALVSKGYPQLELVSVGGINDRGEIAGQACKLVSGACPTSNPTLVTFLAIPR